LLCPLTEKKDKRLSAHNQIDTGNLLSNVLTPQPAQRVLTGHREARLFLDSVALLSFPLFGQCTPSGSCNEIEIQTFF
jgi:hypothetical protein